MQRPNHKSASSLIAIALASTIFVPATVQARTINDNVPQVYVMTPTGVNLQTGAFMHSTTDFSMGPLTFVRSWGSVPTFSTQQNGFDDNRFGYWNHNYGFGVKVNVATNDTFADIYVEGHKYRFKWTGAIWQPSVVDNDNKGAELTVSGGVFTYLSRGGDIYRFRTHPGTGKYTTSADVGQEAIQLIDAVDYADGSRLDFTYDSSARMRTIASNRGYAIVLDYGVAGEIATACGYNTTTTYIDGSSTCATATVKSTYTYSATAVPLLASATDATGASSTFQYDNYTGRYSRLTCATIPGTGTCEYLNTYGNLPGEALVNGEFQVRRQVDALGKTWNFAYDHSDNEQYVDYEHPLVLGSFMTDPLGVDTYATYTSGYITQLTERGVTTKYGYSGVVPELIELPEGNKTLLAHDRRQNLIARTEKAKPGSPEASADHTWTADYPADHFSAPDNYINLVGCEDAVGQRMPQKLCDKPRSVTDAKNHTTYYAYDPANGLVLTETAPAVNGVTPQIRYSYEQRYAWLKNAGGTWSQAANPVWLLTRKSICREGSSAISGNGCADPADEVVTTFDYGPSSGPNNLLLRGTIEDSGAGRLNLRTCVAYDEQGNRISNQTPRAGASTCN